MANNSKKLASFVRSLKDKIGIRRKRANARGTLILLNTKQNFWWPVRRFAVALGRFAKTFEKWTGEVEYNLVPRSEEGEEVDPLNPLRLRYCQSTNHEECDFIGNLWTCDRCKRTFCIGDGMADDYDEICDSCWSVVTERGTEENSYWWNRGGDYERRDSNSASFS